MLKWPWEFQSHCVRLLKLQLQLADQNACLTRIQQNIQASSSSSIKGHRDPKGLVLLKSRGSQSMAVRSLSSSGRLGFT